MFNNKIIDSPCNGVCRYDKNKKQCLGCFRTGDEIGAWREANALQKQYICEKVRARKLKADVLYTKDLMSRVIQLPNSISRIVSFSDSSSRYLRSLHLDHKLITDIDVVDLNIIKPDLIIVDQNHKKIKEIVQQYPNTWVSDVKNIKDALKLVKRIAKLFSVEEKASFLIEKIKNQIHLKSNLNQFSCLCVLDPYEMAAIDNAHFVNYSLEQEGFINLFKDKTTKEKLSKAMLIEYKPEYVFLSCAVAFQKKEDLSCLKNQFKNIKFLSLESKMYDWYDFIINT